MRPASRAGLATALALGWWLGLAPSITDAVRARRAAERIEPGVHALAHAIASARRSLLPSGPEAEAAAAAVQEAALDLEVERGWTLKAAVVLNPSQRLDPGRPPERPRARHQPWLDPELPALYESLSALHGWSLRPSPDLPPFDPWPGVEPRRRAEALRVLAPTLSDEQAAVITGLVLEAMAAAQRRDAAEDTLRELLDPAVVLLAARDPGRGTSVDDAVSVLRARAR